MIQLPRELTDPAAQMRLAARVQSISSALLNVRVGDLAAAIEGREPTSVERNVTVGDLVRQKDPNFDRDVAQGVATWTQAPAQHADDQPYVAARDARCGRCAAVYRSRCREPPGPHLSEALSGRKATPPGPTLERWRARQRQKNRLSVHRWPDWRFTCALPPLMLTGHVAALPVPALSVLRKVRLVLAEKGVGHELVRENPWERRDEFMDLNPAGETPVMVEADQGVTLIGSQPIVEYFDETVDRMPMIHGNAAVRAEIRRMTEWFDMKLYREAVEPLMNERMRKRLVNREPPDTRVLREAMRTASEHLDYLDYLLDHRRWLAGPGLSLADFTAAAHLSVIDYLGALDWRGHKQTKDWYAVMKSRPCFRPLLAERMEVIVPPSLHYEQLLQIRLLNASAMPAGAGSLTALQPSIRRP